MEEADKKEIQKMIDSSVDEAMRFSTRKLGDTPTDDLQLVNKKYITTKFYAGYVLSTGTVGFLPDGWTVVESSAGIYDVTHNLGTTDYSVVVTPLYNSGLSVPGSRGAEINTVHTSTSFRVNTFTTTNSADNEAEFFFIVMLK